MFATRFETSERSAYSFLEIIEHALALIAVFPEIGPVFSRPYRRFLLQDKNIALFYTLEGRRVFIHAVFDLRQNPSHLRRRLGLES